MVRLERGNFDMPTNQFRIEISWNMRIWPVGESLNVEGEVFFLVPWGWAREKKTILRRKQLNAKCETTSFGTSQKPIATCPIGDVFWYIWLKWTTSNICKPCARWYVNPFQEILHAMYALFANIQLSLFPAAVVHLLQTKTFQLLLSSLHVTFGGCTKSDIFSVGVVAFQAACGKHPFINEDLLDVQDKLSPPDFFCVFVKVVFSKIKTKLVVWFRTQRGGPFMMSQTFGEGHVLRRSSKCILVSVIWKQRRCFGNAPIFWLYYICMVIVGKYVGIIWNYSFWSSFFFKSFDYLDCWAEAQVWALSVSSYRRRWNGGLPETAGEDGEDLKSVGNFWHSLPHQTC